MTRAVVTLAMGEAYRQMGLVTHDLMRAYADRCAADFVVIQEEKVSAEYPVSKKYEKFQVFELLERYAHIVFIDTDVLVSPLAPSLFDLVPMDSFAASAVPYVMKDRDIELTQKVMGPVSWLNPYFNSGVMVFGRSHRPVFDPREPNLQLWANGAFRSEYPNLLNDQPYLNHRINALGLPLFNLGVQFNHTRAAAKSSDRFRNYMIHYAGNRGHRYGSRLAQLDKDRRVFSSCMSLNLSRRLVPYRWMADRLDFDYFHHLLKKL